MTEKIPVQTIEDVESTKISIEGVDANIENAENTDAEPKVEVRESLRTAELDDFTPAVLEKAQKYRERVAEYKTSQESAKDRLSVMDWNDPDKPYVERELRQANKEESLINADLLNADANLMRAERRFFEKYKKYNPESESDSSGENVIVTPESVIGAFDDKFATLESSVAEANTYIEEHRKAYHLNTTGAYKDPVLGPKMKERDSFNKELSAVRLAWEGIGGNEIDKAREMVAIKKAYDLLPESEGGLEEELDFEKLKNSYERLKGIDPSKIEDHNVVMEIVGEIRQRDDLTKEQAQAIESSILSYVSGLEGKKAASPTNSETKKNEQRLEFEKLISLNGEIDLDNLSNLSDEDKSALEKRIHDYFRDALRNKDIKLNKKPMSHGGREELRYVSEHIKLKLDQVTDSPEEYKKAQFQLIEFIETDLHLSTEERVELTKQVLYSDFIPEIPELDYNEGREAAEKADTGKKEQEREKIGFFKKRFSRKNLANKARLSGGTSGPGSSDRKQNNVMLGASLAWYNLMETFNRR